MKQYCFACLGFLVLIGHPAVADGYRTSVGTEPDRIPVVVVTGTPFEMGQAIGALMKPEIQAFIPGYVKAIQETDPSRFSDTALDKAWAAVSKHTSARYTEELKGIATESGVSFDLLRRAHMIPVVGDYSCSGIAVWGAATKNSHVLQIRNLDFAMDGHLQDFPMVAIYIPKEGIPHMNVSFAGVIGVNTGMNAEGIALSEIGDSPQNDFPFDLNGAHFMSLFRDILYDAHHLDDAVRQIQDAKRIKKYHYVIGAGKQGKAVKMRAYAPRLDVWHDNDPNDELAPNVLKGVVYHAEERDPVAYAYLKTHLGAFTPDAMIQLSKSIGTLDGNLLNVVYDATALEAWIAYGHGENECAYRRPYVPIKLNDYLPFTPADQKIKMEAVYPSK